MSSNLKLDEEYKSIRAALVKGGIDLTESMDALYRDWRRWRDKSLFRAEVNTVELQRADQWWAQHLEQFRCLIDPLHVAARAERIRKDRDAATARPQLARNRRPNPAPATVG